MPRTVVGPGTTRWYLSSILGCSPEEVPFRETILAEPPTLEARRLPERWRDLRFSRTTTGEFCWTAFHLGEGLGLDVEPFTRPPSSTLETFLDILPPRLAEEVRRAPPDARSARAVMAWTWYEAWAKATGRGISLCPGDLPPEARVISFEPGDGYAGAVATFTDVDGIDLLEVEPPEPV